MDYVKPSPILTGFFNSLQRVRVQVFLLYLISSLGWIPTAYAQKNAKSSLVEIHQFNTSSLVRATAISSDEALIALALEQSDQSILELIDRQTFKKIASLTLEDQTINNLQFFPNNADYLLISTKKSLQLWNLENLPTSSDQSISSNRLLWKKEGKPVMNLQFDARSKAVWTEGKEIEQLATEDNDFSSSKIWTPIHLNMSHLTGFSIHPSSQWLALYTDDSTHIQFISWSQEQSHPPLDYHRFPITDLQFTQSNVLLSLDREGNLIWGHTKSRNKIDGFLVSTQSPSEQTVSFKLLNRDDYLAVISESHSYLFTKKGILLDILPLQGKDTFTASPTGTYLLSSPQSKTVTVHQFKFGLPPESYYHQLLRAGFQETARRYRNYLDTIPQELTQLSEYSSQQDELSLLLKNLSAAEKAKQWREVLRWTDEILFIDSENPIALATKERFKQHQNQVWFEEGVLLFEEKAYQEAKRVLLKIGSQSDWYAETKELIAHIDFLIRLSHNQESAIRASQHNHWVTAKAHAQKILELQPHHLQTTELGQNEQNIFQNQHESYKEKAEEILDTVEEAEFFSHFWNFVLIAGVLGAFSTLGIFAFYRRKHLQQWMSEQSDIKAPRPNAKPKATTRKTTHTHASHKTDQKQFFAHLEQAFKLILKAKYTDKNLQFTERILHFEKEISNLEKEAHLHNPNFKNLNTKLGVLTQTLQSLIKKNTKTSTSSQHSEQTKQTKENNQQTYANHQQDTRRRKKFAEEQKQKQQGFEYTHWQDQGVSDNSNSTQETKYHQILGISPHASQEEIKKAYHQKIKQYHPDRHQSSDFDWIKEEAEKKTKEIQEAYEKLKA